MPYDKLADLPDYVKKLPEKKQRQWQHVVNSCLKDGKAESTCFATANGVVKKEISDFETPADAELPTCDDATIELATKEYQYVDSWEYESRKMSQEEAAYQPAGGTTDKACSNCFFFVSPARCTVVAGVIAPNGVSNQWRAVPKYEPQPLEVVIVDKSVLSAGEPGPSAGAAASDVQLPTVKAGAFAEPVQSGLKGFMQKALTSLGLADKKRAQTEGFVITKQADGRLRWITRYSNAWEDRDGEILTEASQKDYLEWSESNKAYPELWVWHTPGTRFGQADWLAFDNGFAFASGLIDDTDQARSVVKALAAKQANDVGVSHGFLSVQTGKYITKHRTFEISVLPRERAAVWTTDFNVIGKETLMAFDPTKRQWLVDTFGEETVKQLETNTEQTAAQLKQLGLEYKESSPPDETAKAAEKATSDANAEALRVMGGTLATLVEQVGSIATLVGSQQKEITALKQTDDEKVASAFEAKVKQLGAAGAVRPTASTSNILDEAKAKELGAPSATGAAADFFTEMILGQVGPVAQAAGVAMAPVTIQQQSPQLP